MFEYWFLAAIAFLGIITSYEDIRFGKIRNIWILGALVFALGAYLMLFLSGTLSFTAMHWYSLLLNSIIALVVGIILWKLRLWTAGDAKLFFAFMLLIPPLVSGARVVLSVVDMLINTFIPIGLYLAFSAIERSSFDQKKRAFERTFDPRRFFAHLLFIFVLIWPVHLLTSIFNLHDSTFIIVLVIALIARSVRHLYHIFSLIAIGILAALRLFFDPSIASLSSWFQFALTALFFVVVTFFIEGVASSAFSKQVSSHQLKAGMMPAELLVKESHKIQRKPLGLALSDQDSLVYIPKSEGLSVSDVKKIRSLKGVHGIMIRETISFAPFLFAGTLLQFFLHENIVTYLIVLFSLF